MNMNASAARQQHPHDVDVPSAAPLLAARSTRFVAALIDGLIWCFAPLSFLLISQAVGFRVVDDDPSTGMPGLFVAAWFLVLTVYSLWLLVARGQSPGKRLVGIKIVKLDGTRASFGVAVIMRALVPLLLDIVPGFVLLDPLFILRDDRRCLHDLIAGTKVVVVPKSVRAGTQA
jgi:uncharacterized RDD family membrane protein YckC